MIRKIIGSILFVVLFYSCASTFGVSNLGAKVRKLEIGMTKKEALKILGNTYDVVAASQAQEGKVESLRFISTTNNTYLLHFLDGKLVEFHEGKPYHINENHPHKHGPH